MIPLVVKAIAIWALILCLAFINAGLRELVLIPRCGRAMGLSLSGAILCVLVLLVAWTASPWLGATRAWDLVAVGLGWLILTVAFEWGLGWMQGKSAGTMFEAYRFKDGNLWPLVLGVTAVAPWLAARLRNWL